MIRCFTCGRGGDFREQKDPARVLREFKSRRIMSWVDFETPTEAELGLLTKKFGFHNLAVEDVSKGRQRPKIENYEGYDFIVLRTPAKDLASAHQFNIFLSKKYIVTVNLHPVPEEAAAIEKAAKNPELLRKGPDAVLYSILDAFVDAYFPALKELDDQVDRIEEEIVSGKASPRILHRLLLLKRRAANLRRITWPMRDLANSLARGESNYISEKNLIYFRDIHDHLVRIVEQVDVTRDMISTTMEAYLSVVSNNLNVAMKKLTAIATILFVPALIAGVYGMNFKYMPELGWEHGYYFALGAMAVVTGGLYLYFKQREWL